MSPRTETSYKAERPGEVAPHTEAQGSGRTVDGGVVQLQFAFLSGETCSAERSSRCIDASATSAESASYSAAESAGGGNVAGDGTGVSREHTTAVNSTGADAPSEDATGRLEQEGRGGPRTLSTSTQKLTGPVEADALPRRSTWAPHGTTQAYLTALSSLRRSRCDSSF